MWFVFGALLVVSGVVWWTCRRPPAQPRQLALTPPRADWEPVGWDPTRDAEEAEPAPWDAKPQEVAMYVDPFDPSEPEPITDRDPGDEVPAPAVPDWCMCPRNHVAHLRHRDQAIFCEMCGEIYLNEDFARTYRLDLAA